MSDAQKTLLSILCSIGGFGLFSAADACVKYLGALGYHTFTIQLYGVAVSLMIGTIYILLHKRKLSAFLPRKPFKYHIWRVLFLLIGVYFLINALQMLEMAEFYAIAFLSPFLVTLCAAFLFKEHVGLPRWGAVGAGFIGVLVAVSAGLFDINNAPPLEGIIYALIMVVCLTASYLIIRKMGHGEYPPLYPLYAQIGIGVFSIITVTVLNIETPVPPPQEWGIWILYGGAIFMAVILTSTAFSIAPVAAIPAPFQYTQIIWGVLFGYFLFAEVPRAETILGLLIIIAAGLFMVWREYRVAKKARKLEI